MKLEKHVGTAADYIGHRAPATQTHQRWILRRRSIVHRQIILNYVTLVPNPVNIINNAFISKEFRRELINLSLALTRIKEDVPPGLGYTLLRSPRATRIRDRQPPALASYLRFAIRIR